MEEVCERCYLSKDQGHMASFEYGEVTIRVCLTCLQAVVGVLVRAQLARRATKLRAMQENWKARNARRAS
jgi:uncharacterized UBP type Zn finger protein